MAVSDHVYKTKQLISISRGNLPEAVIRKQGLPVGLTSDDNSNFKCVAVKSGDLKILKRPSQLASIRREFTAFGRLKHRRLGPEVSLYSRRQSMKNDLLKSTDDNSKINSGPSTSSICCPTLVNPNF